MIAGQLSQMLLGLADTMMIGRVGTVELAAVAFVNSLFFLGFALASGLFAAVSVRVSHAFGSARPESISGSLRHGLLLSLLFGLFLSLAYLGLSFRLDWFRQPPEVTELSGSYFRWLALSYLPMVPMLTLKSFSEALNKPWPVLWLMLGTVVLNVWLNYLLIFGNAGLPAMGLDGAGCATFLARCAGFVAVFVYICKSPQMRPRLPARWCAPIDWSVVRYLVKLGLPISLQVSLEFAVFAACSLLMGQFGSTTLAAHQIAFTCSSTAFMLPLGLSMALTIRVGHAVGAQQWVSCRRMILGALLMITGAMSLTGAVFVGFGSELAASFTLDQDVVRMTAAFLVVVAIYQGFDGIQVISMSALRGMHDVYVPTWINFGNFFLFAVPLGIVLAFFVGLGGIGLWYGVATGMCVSAIVLTTRLRLILRRQSAPTS
ncbi:MATE family efflux transporter [Coraliomargarita algicola]|uniref:Multidrug-efflux transporter n=1 Tax=Coraliomargarita algicola TaxID=3092156 RepID=A0ABZ0RHX2_9BACT|nr:MATE family efflux transporter [Coraliomargarita sp. J2-16]WPJ94854.1 MATE family efflux transporter [Coraliomargarita sp. J2-16]